MPVVFFAPIRGLARIRALFLGMGGRTGEMAARWRVGVGLTALGRSRTSLILPGAPRGPLARRDQGAGPDRGFHRPGMLPAIGAPGCGVADGFPLKDKVLPSWHAFGKLRGAAGVTAAAVSRPSMVGGPRQTIRIQWVTRVPAGRMTATGPRVTDLFTQGLHGGTKAREVADQVLPCA